MRDSRDGQRSLANGWIARLSALISYFHMSELNV